MRFRFQVPLVPLACLFLLAGGCGQEADEEAEETIHYDPVPVRVVAAKSATLQPTLDLIGTIVVMPERTAILSPLEGGTIAKVLVIEGQRVRAGDVLVQLDPRLARADLAKATATLGEKSAVLARLKRGPRPQEIDAVRQDAQKFKAAAEALRVKVKALSPLREKQEVSQVQVDAAQASLQAAEAEHAAASARVALMEAGTSPEEIAEAEAVCEVAKAELASAQLACDCCQIASPITGMVMHLSARQGMTVDRTTPLATLADDAAVFAQFRVPHVYLDKVRPAAAVTVRLTALPDAVFHGTVTRLSGQADPNSGAVDAFATLPNDKGLLKPGLGCRLSVALPEIPGATVIPVAAVADRSGTPVVTVIKDNKAREVEVKLGTQAGDQVQVLEGLAPGDLVAIENGYGLPDDCPVRILDDAPAAAGAAK